VHVHFDAPNKCIYCGSKVLGGGCIFNPFGKNHVRGPEFLANVKEQTKNSTILSYLYESILNSDKSNAPMTPLNRFFRRLAGIVGTLGQPLLESFQYQSKPTFSQIPKEQTILAFEIKERLEEQYKQINETIKHANLSLPQEIVEDIMVDAIISFSEKNK
jgi:hypothetical protein